MIYFDNAATSYPKPSCVTKAVSRSFNEFPSNPGRSGYKSSVKTAEMIYKARESLDSFFNGYGSENVVFTNNCTTALNLAIKGYLKKGDHVIISSLEHNSVLRPVHQLYEQGIVEYDVFEVWGTEENIIDNFKNAFKSNTKLCVVTAVSNVFGDILPLKRLSGIAHSESAAFFVDGAQGAGIVPIDMKKSGIDCLCVPGHKGLLGPMGTGALLHKEMDFYPLISGGTGSKSLSVNQPYDYPDRLESGTLNVPGICGLLAGVNYVQGVGVKNIFEKEGIARKLIVDGLSKIDGVRICENAVGLRSGPVVSFNVNSLHSEVVAEELNKGDVAVRGGYHCSSLAHKTRGTINTGSVRVSPSFLTSEKDIKFLLNLVRKIAISNFI